MLEGACRANEEQLAVREAEIQQIPVLRTQLEELNVKISIIMLSGSDGRVHSHLRFPGEVWRRCVRGRMRWWQ